VGGQNHQKTTPKHHKNGHFLVTFTPFYTTRRVVVQIFIIKTTQNLAKIAQNAPLGANYDRF